MVAIEVLIFWVWGIALDVTTSDGWVTALGIIGFVRCDKASVGVVWTGDVIVVPTGIKLWKLLTADDMAEDIIASKAFIFKSSALAMTASIRSSSGLDASSGLWRLLELSDEPRILWEQMRY